MDTIVRMGEFARCIGGWCLSHTTPCRRRWPSCDASTRTSNRREARYALRRRQYACVAHLCSDHRHRTTSAIAKRDGTVKVETLNRAGMQRNRKRLTSQVENRL